MVQDTHEVNAFIGNQPSIPTSETIMDIRWILRI